MENTLNIQVTLDDKQLKDLIVGNINDLPKEKLQDVLLGAIKEFLTSQRGQELFVIKSGYYNSIAEPSKFLKDLVEDADITKSISPVVNEAVEQFANNYHKIMENCIRNVVSGMFIDQFTRAQISESWNHIRQQSNN